MDVAKGICMFFIISAHTGFVMPYYDYFYNSFFLVAYFILSGYLFHNPSLDFPVAKKITRVIESILVPYLVYWALSYAIGALVKGDYNFLPGLFQDIIMGQKLWFMSCLIVSEIIFALFLSISKKNWWIVLFIGLNLFVWHFFKDVKLPWSIELSFMASVFLAVGYFIRIYNEIFSKYLTDNRLGAVIIILWFGIIITQCIVQYKISFPGNDFGNLFFYIPYVIVGSFALFFLAAKWKSYNKAAVFLGQNSLLYYFFQNQALGISKHIAAKLGFTEKNYFLPIIIALLVALALVIPIILIKKYFPLLAGKSLFLSKRMIVHKSSKEASQ